MRFAYVLCLIMLVGCSIVEVTSPYPPYTETNTVTRPAPTPEQGILSATRQIICNQSLHRIVVTNEQPEQAFTFIIDGQANAIDNVRRLNVTVGREATVVLRQNNSAVDILPEAIEADCRVTLTPEANLMSQPDLVALPISIIFNCLDSGSPHPPSTDTIGATVVNRGGVDTGEFLISSNRLENDLHIENLASHQTLTFILPETSDFFSTLVLLADSDERLVETNEGNNGVSAYTGCIRPT